MESEAARLAALGVCQPIHTDVGRVLIWITGPLGGMPLRRSCHLRRWIVRRRDACAALQAQIRR